MSTFPYLPEQAAAVAKSHRQVIHSEAVITGASGPVDLAPSAGTITLAEDASPYVQAQLTVPAAALLDPRRGDQVSIRAGYGVPGMSDDVHQVAHGYVRSFRRPQPGDTAELTVWGAEALTQDAKWLGAPLTKSFTGVREALEWLVEYALGAPGVWSQNAPALLRPDLAGEVILEPGTEIWELLHGLALAAGMRVYCDHLNVWHLTAKPTRAAVTDAYLKTGAEGTVDASEQVLDVDPYYSAAVLKYTWKDTAGTERTVYGRWSPPVTGAQMPGAGQKTFYAERRGPVSQATADNAARLTVRNLSTRGHSYVVESVIQWWLRPGMTVQVSLQDGTDVRHIAQRIVFNLSTGKMTVTTREPSNLGEL